MNDTDTYLRALRREGYTVTKTKRRNHWKIYSGGQVVAVTGSTPGKSALVNLKSDIRKWERDHAAATA